MQRTMKQKDNIAKPPCQVTGVTQQWNHMQEIESTKNAKLILHYLLARL